MVEFTKQTITLNEFKNQIIDDFYLFGNTNRQNTMVETYAETLTPYIYNIIQTTLLNQLEQIINENLLNLKVKYREILQKYPDDIVPIHLFSFTLLNQLENEADELNNNFLGALWSETADEIAEISLNENGDKTTSS